MARESFENKQKRARVIFRRLRKEYPTARMLLRYSNHWELLVAVMLSAQCTDIKVNEVTKRLFKKYRTLDDYVHANPKEFEQDIFQTGFYKVKTAHVLGAATMLQKEWNSVLPRTIQELIRLPGVGRKTANVVLGNAYGHAEGIAVDTHVQRLSRRLGLSSSENTDKIEQDLMRLVPQAQWFNTTYLCIDHGRAICDARRPKCDVCPLSTNCPSAFQFPQFKK